MVVKYDGHYQNGSRFRGMTTLLSSDLARSRWPGVQDKGLLRNNRVIASEAIQKQRWDPGLLRLKARNDDEANGAVINQQALSAVAPASVPAYRQRRRRAFAVLAGFAGGAGTDARATGAVAVRWILVTRQAPFEAVDVNVVHPWEA